MHELLAVIHDTPVADVEEALKLKKLEHDCISDADGSDFDELAHIEQKVKHEFEILDLDKGELFDFKTLQQTDVNLTIDQALE